MAKEWAYRSEHDAHEKSVWIRPKIDVERRSAGGLLAEQPWQNDLERREEDGTTRNFVRRDAGRNQLEIGHRVGGRERDFRRKQDDDHDAHRAQADDAHKDRVRVPYAER